MYDLQGADEELEGRMLVTYGFLGYPVLQAADIVLYNADAVPVGMDQLLIWSSPRDSPKFNSLYGKEIFKEPGHPHKGKSL